MNRSVANHKPTDHRLVALKPYLLECTKLATENSGISQNNYLPAEVPYLQHLQPLPRLENESHDEHIRA